MKKPNMQITKVEISKLDFSTTTVYGHTLHQASNTRQTSHSLFPKKTYLTNEFPTNPKKYLSFNANSLILSP